MKWCFMINSPRYFIWALISDLHVHLVFASCSKFDDPCYLSVAMYNNNIIYTLFGNMEIHSSVAMLNFRNCYCGRRFEDYTAAGGK